mmetsp:Transcript_5044/g.12739  ORF Transcript_5044/g.12739 Transcript_5044/m.12739 type:complete len:375 (-) Transcript_5044:688-1812(-)
MTSRLNDLRGQAATASERTPRGSKKSPRTSTASENSGAFNRQSRIMSLLQGIETNVNEYIEDVETIAHNIAVLSNELKRTFSKEDEAAQVREFQKNMDEGNEYCRKVKNCLDDLEKLLKPKPGGKKEPMTPKEREYATAVSQATTSKFQKAVKQMLASQSMFEKEAKHRMNIALQTLYPEASADEVAQIVDGDPQVMQTMVRNKQKGGSGYTSKEMREQLDLLQQQSDAMLELEQSVIELHELFFYLSSLVDQQSKTLQSIEEKVNNTDKYVGEGVEKLEQAEKHQTSYQWKKRWMEVVCVCLVVTAVALGVVLCLVYCQPCYTACCGGSTKEIKKETVVREVAKKSSFLARGIQREEENVGPTSKAGVFRTMA